MGAIAGILQKAREPWDKKAVAETMKSRGPAGVEILNGKECTFFHGLKQPRQEGKCCLQRAFGNVTYRLTWCGNLYNREDLIRELKLDTDIFLGDLILKAYKAWGANLVSRLNGVFAFALWESPGNHLLLARDPMGGKPLFFTLQQDRLIFGSQRKNILAFPGTKAVLDQQGVLELMMLGPGRMPGSGLFKGIRELEPGCIAEYTDGHLTVRRYWRLQDGSHTDSFPETAAKVRWLITDAVKRQTADADSYGAMLSGGLDSSILCGLCRRQDPKRKIQTFSVDYQGNSRYFVPGKYQPDSDNAYIDLMCQDLGSLHRTTVLTPEVLEEGLKEAMLARDQPGMGDVDSSLLAFSREIRKDTPMVLSGECADELFGGYPWYRDPEIRQQEGFPWAQNRHLRSGLIKDPPKDAEDFPLDVCRDALRKADILPENDPENRRIKELVHLNMFFFMQTLVERNDCMSWEANLEIRAPFCDVRIAEYLYRIPWAMKNHGDREKGLLREAAKGLIPEQIRLRKKSPYPKTFDPHYEALVTQKVRDLLLQDRPIWYLIRREKVLKILAEGLLEPWYGQLMKLPQFCAWILQIDLWLEHYGVTLSY